MNNQRLTIKQKRFVNEYIKTGNATESAARAYNVKKRITAKAVGGENLTKPNIQGAIEAKFKKEDLTVEWVLQGLKYHAEQTEARSTSIKAYELIGKYLSMFTEKTEQKIELEGKRFLID